MPMSQQELELVALQSDILRDAQNASRAGADLNQMLTPILLEEAGYTVTRADADVRNPEFDTLTARVSELGSQLQGWDKYVNFNDGGEATLSSAGRFISESGEGKRIKAAIEEYNSARSRLMSTGEFSQRAGDILSLERIANPATDLRQQNEQLLLERQNAALRGELPVSPALLRDLEDQEATLRETLLQQLGPGFETSTPGIEALANFRERRDAILEATRRDDIASAGQQANAMGGFLESLNASRTGRVTGAGALPFMSSSNLAGLSSGFSNPLQYLQGNRALDFQIAQANNAPNLLESLVAQGAGTAMTFGIADLFKTQR